MEPSSERISRIAQPSCLRGDVSLPPSVRASATERASRQTRTGWSTSKGPPRQDDGADTRQPAGPHGLHPPGRVRPLRALPGLRGPAPGARLCACHVPQPRAPPSKCEMRVAVTAVRSPGVPHCAGHVSSPPGPSGRGRGAPALRCDPRLSGEACAVWKPGVSSG